MDAITPDAKSDEMTSVTGASIRLASSPVVMNSVTRRMPASASSASASRARWSARSSRRARRSCWRLRPVPCCIARRFSARFCSTSPSSTAGPPLRPLPPRSLRRVLPPVAAAPAAGVVPGVAAVEEKASWSALRASSGLTCDSVDDLRVRLPRRSEPPPMFFRSIMPSTLVPASWMRSARMTPSSVGASAASRRFLRPRGPLRVASAVTGAVGLCRHRRGVGGCCLGRGRAGRRPAGGPLPRRRAAGAAASSARARASASAASRASSSAARRAASASARTRASSSARRRSSSSRRVTSASARTRSCSFASRSLDTCSLSLENSWRSA